MTKAEKLKELQNKLETLQNPPVDISQFFINDELAKITEQLKANPTIRALQKFNGDLQKLQSEVSKLGLDVAPLQTAIKQVQKELKQGQANLLQEFESRLRNLPQAPDFTPQLETLRTEFDTRIKAILVDDDSALEADLQNIRQQLQDMVTSNELEDRLDKEELEKSLRLLRSEIMNRISNLGGGSMNRQILFNSVDRLTKYTDINLKPGANVTFTVAEDAANKRVNLTIAATGGSGSGITRSIQNISASQTADAALVTDYTYICTGTLTLTMPTCVGNSNLYVIKNTGTGTVTINFTGAETGDNQATLVMPVRYTSIDLISDGTSNWAIT